MYNLVVFKTLCSFINTFLSITVLFHISLFGIGISDVINLLISSHLGIVPVQSPYVILG